jgi:hypothetical protein
MCQALNIDVCNLRLALPHQEPPGELATIAPSKRHPLVTDIPSSPIRFKQTPRTHGRLHAWHGRAVGLHSLARGSDRIRDTVSAKSRTSRVRGISHRMLTALGPRSRCRCGCGECSVATNGRMHALMLAGRTFGSLYQSVCSHDCDMLPTSYIRFRCISVPPHSARPLVLACGAVRAPPRARPLRRRQHRCIYVGVGTHSVRRGFGGPMRVRFYIRAILSSQSFLIVGYTCTMMQSTRAHTLQPQLPRYRCIQQSTHSALVSRP